MLSPFSPLCVMPMTSMKNLRLSSNFGVSISRCPRWAMSIFGSDCMAALWLQTVVLIHALAARSQCGQRPVPRDLSSSLRCFYRVDGAESHLRRQKADKDPGRISQMRKFTIVLVAVAAMALPSAALAQTKIVIGIPTSPPNIVHMPPIVAAELGLYKKAGIDAELGSLGDGTKVFRALLAGNIDFGLTPGAPTIIGISNGANVKALSANLPKFEASLVVRDNIKTMDDLKGKRIGIQEPGGFADILSRAVLRAAKIDPKEVNFVSIASEDVPALVANQVDTAILHVEQEMFAKSKVPDLHPIARMWELQPKTLYTFLSATEKTIAEKPDVVQKVVAANIEATRIMYQDKAKIIPILVKQTG